MRSLPKSASFLALVLSAAGAPAVAADPASAPAAPAATGAKSAASSVIDAEKNENRVMDTLHHLVNVIGPRLTSSHNDHIACEWAKEQFESYGLSNVVMEEAGEFPVAFHRGPWSGKMLAPETLVLEFGTPAWSAGTRGAVAGPAMLAPETLEGADPAAYRGAWILNAPGAGGGRRRSPEERKAQQEIREFLEKAGVAGFISSTRNQYIITGGSPRIDWENLPKFPRINLLKDHFDRVMEHVKAGTPVQLQFDIRNHFEKGPAKYYNVYADLVGSEFPDELVIVGGHIDSWDGATGTTDNGMGAATTLEAARLLAATGAKPRRTIRFMLWSGEEQGLLGSEAYVKKNPDLLPKISAVLVYDGGPNAISSLPTTEAMHAQMETAFAAVIGLNPEYPFALKKQANGLPRGIGSDHESFLPHNVPGFFWDQEGRADWRHGIHTQFDTYDLSIPEYLEHSSLVIALGALGIADLDALLDRTGLWVERQGDGGGRRMGVMLDELTIEGVSPDTPAEKAGLLPEDVFYKVDGVVVADREALVEAIRSGPPKKSVTVKRGDREVTVELVWPDEKPPEEPAKKEKVVL